jgi:hypothetical protein
MTPKALHKMYKTLKTQLEKSMNLITASKDQPEGLMTFEQFMNKLQG